MIKNSYQLILLLFAACLLNACTDAQDEHYSRSDSLPDQTLSEWIAGNADLSAFAQLLDMAGYNELLASSQTFTVWAPNNNALAGIDLNTITQDAARLMVENHIARYNHSTSENPFKGVRMKSNKVYYFSEEGSRFGNAAIQKRNIVAKNGVLHILQSQIQFFPNIYEYMLTSPNTSKIAEFIRQFDEQIIDPASIDADGTIRDTVYIRYNRLFDKTDQWLWYGTLRSGLGQINREDSIYTALIPDNTAWDAAYERIAPSFKAVRNNDSIQRMQTSLAIVENLIFRGFIDRPADEDSLFSTSPNVIRQPALLFDNTQKIQASNGLLFLTETTVNYHAQETWMRPIFVEADEQEGRKIAANTTLVPRIIENNTNGLATDSRFLEVYQTALDDNLENQPKVTFDIPQVLSGRYNIYAEFLPGDLAQHGNPRATKLRCTLNYRNVNGNTVTTVANNLQTSATEKIKLLLFNGFNFPVANYYDRIWEIDFIDGLHSIDERITATKLDIAVRVNAADYNSQQFGRSFCIDRIIFEPVQN